MVFEFAICGLKCLLQSELLESLLIYFSRMLERWAYFSSSAVIALSSGMKEGVVRCGYPHPVYPLFLMVATT